MQKSKLSNRRMHIYAELVNYSEDSSEELGMMQPRTANGEGFFKALFLQEGGARLVLMIKVP